MSYILLPPDMFVSVSSGSWYHLVSPIVFRRVILVSDHWLRLATCTSFQRVGCLGFPLGVGALTRVTVVVPVCRRPSATGQPGQRATHVLCRSTPPVLAAGPKWRLRRSAATGPAAAPARLSLDATRRPLVARLLTRLLPLLCSRACSRHASLVRLPRAHAPLVRSRVRPAR